MIARQSRIRALMTAVVAATVWSAHGVPAGAAEPINRSCSPQETASTISSTSADALAQLRIECPLLAAIVEKFALRDMGEEFFGAGINPQSSALAAEATTASEDIEALRHRAEEALRAGASQFELKEMLYLTVLNAGVPRGIEVTRALSDLLVKPAPAAEPAANESERLSGAPRHF